MKGSKKGVFSEFLLSPSLGSGSVKGGQFSVTIGGHFSMTFDSHPPIAGFRWHPGKLAAAADAVRPVAYSAAQGRD